ncbi:MAG: hypothetical protein FWG68_06940 [Defluviitaleaceae bacterium]|nr:hypothetical protein [Defluviitaleaceae bacterium]
MRKLAIFLILAIFLAGCGGDNSPSPLIGSWQLEDQLSFVLVFNEDGTGHEIFEGNEFDFLWRTDGGFVDFSMVGDDLEESLLSALMEIELHGATVDRFGFSFPEDNILYLTDDHEHGHFLLIFSRG